MQQDPNNPERSAQNKLDFKKLKEMEPMLVLVEEGYNQAEIGRILGVSQQAVSKRLRRIANFYAGQNGEPEIPAQRRTR